MSTERPPTTSDRAGEINGIDGDLPEGKIVIVASRYNAAICDSMVDAAVKTIIEAGYPEHLVPVVRVPGAWEVPAVVRTVIEDDDVIGVIALGCVVKGETTHDEHINRCQQCDGPDNRQRSADRVRDSDLQHNGPSCPTKRR